MSIKDRAQVRQQRLEECHRVARMDRATLDGRRLAALRRQLEYACAHSPFYRKRREEQHLPHHVLQLGDVREWPFTTKEDLRAAYPFGLLAAPMGDVIRYGESTGSTGSPTSAFMTYADWERGNVWLERCLEVYFGPRDIVFIAIPYELAFASYDIDRAFESVGATIVPVGTLNSVCPWDRILEMMRVIHPTTLVCTPTRALRLYDMFLERGHDPAAVGLETLFYVGETCSEAKLEKIARLWGIRLVSAYGATETNSLALPCARNRLHLAEDRFLFECLTPEGAPAPAGERGELVLTTLHAEAMPLIRYRTGDLVRIDAGSCTCGLPTATIHHYGRLNEAIACGGETLPRYDLEQEVLSVEGTGCYYVAGVEEARLRVLVEVTGPRPRAVVAEVAARLLSAFGIEAVVEPVERRVVAQAMDRMLKPGSVSLASVAAVGAA
jgi:phenylacetate-CoA ligase